MRKALWAEVMIMKKHAWFGLAWAALVGLVCAWTLTSYIGVQSGEFRNEILLRHGLVMLLLTFPSGWLLTALVAVILRTIGLTLGDVDDALLMTIVCGLAGYLQWGVLLPWLWFRWRSFRSNKDEC